MNKVIWVLSFSFLIAACANNTPIKQAESTKVDSMPNKLAPNSLMTINSTKSGFNFKTYLDKNNFEQTSVDSNVLIIVRPTFAIFAFALIDSADANMLNGYDVVRYNKKNGAWVSMDKEHFNVKDLQFERNEVNTDYKQWEFKDMNGDGINDVLLKVEHDGRQNKSYVCYLQDNTKQDFVKVDRFDEISNPDFDAKSKTLKSTNSYHHGQDTETYKLEGLNLRFIKGETVGEYEKKYFKKDGW